MDRDHLDLNREIDVVGFSAHIFNMVVGSGIFVLPAIVATALGSSSIFAYLLCIFLVALVMMCFAEAGSRVTDSGGAYLYIRTAFGPYFGFLTSILFVVSTIAADAAVANAILDILGSGIIVFQGPSYRLPLLGILFATFGLINVKGVKYGVVVVKLVGLIKLIPLILVIVGSWGKVSLPNLAISTIPSFGQIAETTLVLFFAFQGAESALSISGEVKNPQRTIPKGIFLSTLVIFLLYILVQTVAQGILGKELPSFRGNPLGAVADRVFGNVGFTVMTLAAMISMLGYLNSSILSMPRVLFQASRDKVFPLEQLTKIHARFHTPYVSISVYAALGFICAALGGFEQLAIVSSATILLIYIGVSLAVIKLRYEKVGEGLGYKTKGGYLVPILSCLTIIYVLFHLGQKELEVIAVALVLLTCFYFLKTRCFKKQ